MNLTDAEIRERIAKILGWHHLYSDGPPEYELFGYERWDREPDEDGKPVPWWPASVDAALTLCDRLREEGGECFIDNSVGVWRCHFMNVALDINVWLEDPSLARAICLAFLMTQQPTEQETG